MNAARTVALGLVAALYALTACQSAPAPRTDLAAGSGSAAGGGPAGSGAPAGSAAPAAAGAPGTPRQGGTFVVGISAEPPVINPGLTSGSMELIVGCVAYEGLIDTGNDQTPRPLLAEAWQVSPDNMTLTFKLRPGVRWHDGQPFTSADVKFSFEQVLAKYHPRSQPLFSKTMQTVETPDPLTAVLVMNEPYGPILSQLTCESAPILPKHIWEGTEIPTSPRNSKDIVGTGPLKFESWLPGDRITFTRNDQYWREGEPRLDRLMFRIIPEAAARAAALQIGEVDYVTDNDLNRPDFLRLKGDASLQVGLNKVYPRDTMITLNVQRPPFDNKLVRQALYVATDRQMILDQVFSGLGKVGRSAINPDLGWAYNPEIDLGRQYAFDTARANALLDQAGLTRGPDGLRTRPLKFTVEAGRAGFPQMAQIIERNWAAVGVPLTITPLERQVMIDTVYVKRDFDLNLNYLSTGGDPAIGYQRQYTCSNIRPVLFTNGAGFCDSRVDQLYEQGATRVDSAQRAVPYHELQRVLADEVPILLLAHLDAADLGSSKFELESTLWSGANLYGRWGKIYQKGN